MNRGRQFLKGCYSQWAVVDFHTHIFLTELHENFVSWIRLSPFHLIPTDIPLLHTWIGSTYIIIFYEDIVFSWSFPRLVCMKRVAFSVNNRRKAEMRNFTGTGRNTESLYICGHKLGMASFFSFTKYNFKRIDG